MTIDATVSPTPAARAPRASAHELRVVFSIAAYEPVAIALEETPATVGREPAQGLGICLEDKRVSRVHIAVEKRDGSWTLRDQGSRNGTWVDGRACAEATLLPGSVIRIGATLLLFI